jgi:hypothetical protein
MESTMANQHRLGLMAAVATTAGCLAVATVGQPKLDKPEHSGFYREFDAEVLVALCQKQFPFVREKCGTGTRGGGFRWKGETAEEGFRVFDLHGDLSEDEVKQVLDALRTELLRRAKAAKAALGHDPRDTIVDRPMRLLQPGLLWAGTAVVPSDLRGFYFPYKDGKVEGWMDVLAVPMVRDKKTEWLILGAVHEVAR